MGWGGRKVAGKEREGEGECKEKKGKKNQLKEFLKLGSSSESAGSKGAKSRG